MKDRVQRILDLVATERLAPDDAAQLLEALSPKLALSPEARPHVFGLLHAPDFGTAKVTQLLLLRAVPTEVAGRAGGPNFDVPFGLGIEDIGQRISSAVEGVLGSRGPARAGRTLKAEGEDEHGNSFSVNIPLALADHADKLLPPLALKLLEHQGITREALKLLLTSQPPIDPLMEAEDENGNSFSLKVV